MSETKDVTRFIEVLRANPEMREQLREVLFPSSFVKHEELTMILEELKRQREESNQQFKELIKNMNKRFEESNQRFEAQQQEIKQLREDMNKRFEESNQRFKEYMKKLDERNAKHDKDIEELRDINVMIKADVNNLSGRYGKKG